jgi:hypothetical protein
MGGGGGGSGSVDFPEYLKQIQRNILDGSDWSEQIDTLNISIIEALNTSATNSPYVGTVSYDPDTVLQEGNVRLQATIDAINALNSAGDYASAITSATTSWPIETIPFDTGPIDADIESYDTLLTQQLDDIALPKFKAGMQNINAVISSAYIVGEAILRGYKDRELIQYGAALRTKIHTQNNEVNGQLRIARTSQIQAGAGQIVAETLKKLDMISDMTRLSLDYNRIRIMAKKEELSEQLQFDEQDARWYMDSFQYFANVLASIQGGTAPTQGQKRPSQTMSALSGALSGAATGAAIGAPYGGYGALIGAVAGAGLGGYAGYASSQ